MHWFVNPSKTQITCAETGRWLHRHNGEWYIGNEANTGHHDQYTPEAADAMLAALGYRWTGAAIAKIGTPAEPANEPKLVRVDLSKPVEGGLYLVKVKGGSWYTVHHARGTRLSCEIAIAYRLPENTP